MRNILNSIHINEEGVSNGFAGMMESQPITTKFNLLRKECYGHFA